LFIPNSLSSFLCKQLEQRFNRNLLRKNTKGSHLWDDNDSTRSRLEANDKRCRRLLTQT